MNEKKIFKSGFVTILGKPNVGKSTLLNTILNQKLSIVSKKPQTTRRKIVGIYNSENSQIVFIDTPGIIEPEYLLQKKMYEYIISAIKDSDIILLVLDCKNYKSTFQKINPEIIDLIKQSSVLVIINKIDLLENKNDALKIIDELNAMQLFKEIIPASALKNENINEVVSFLKKYLPEHPPYFDKENISDAPTRFFISEIIREKIFEKYYDEIPYSSEVVINEYKERKNAKDFISVNIIVERESQKGIIIGKKGEALKKIGELARKDIEDFIGKGVFLEISAKVRENWRNDENKLKIFGY
jgi:GTP-binding protein Era